MGLYLIINKIILLELNKNPQDTALGFSIINRFK